MYYKCHYKELEVLPDILAGEYVQRKAPANIIKPLLYVCRTCNSI